MNDETKDIDRSQWYVRVTAPGVPYSAIRVAFTREGVAEAVLMCKYLAQEWRKAFDAPPVQPAQEPEEPHYEPFTEADAHPSRFVVAPTAASPAFCPQHKVEMRLSAPQFNKDGDKFYHQLPQEQWTKDARGADVKNHSLWWRETVDANGESNNGKPIPQLVGASR